MNPDFKAEHAKRERHICDLQRKAWADSLLTSMVQSIAYRQACTPQARLAEQAKLLRLIQQWKEQVTRAAGQDWFEPRESTEKG